MGVWRFWSKKDDMAGFLGVQEAKDFRESLRGMKKEECL